MLFFTSDVNPNALIALSSFIVLQPGTTHPWYVHLGLVKPQFSGGVSLLPLWIKQHTLEQHAAVNFATAEARRAAEAGSHGR